MASEKQPKKAGESARAEYRRRMIAREKKVNENFPRAGKYLLKIFSPQNSTKAWDKGAIGEEAIGKLLEEIATEHGYTVLHDLIIPKSKANIDHILVTEFGVFVIDSKNYTGKVEIRDIGGFLSGFQEVLYVGNRKQTVLLEKMKKQIEIVKKVLGSEAAVHAILAFYNAEFPLFFKLKEINGVHINSRGIRKIIEEFPRTHKVDVARTAKAIAAHFN
jgi:hypothetical protein